MPTALIIAAKKPSDTAAPAYGGAESAGEENAEERAKYSVEVPVEGEEIDLTAPDGLDLSTVPQTGRAIVEYSLDCAPDGGSCRMILGKVCFAGGDDSDVAKDGDDNETGDISQKPGAFAAALEKAVAPKADDESA
jgi:hypothetical protein